MNILDIKKLSDKDTLQDEVFLVKNKQTSVGKNGKPFMSLLLGNKTGHIDAKLWDQVDELGQLFEAGDLIKVKGAVQVYNNRKQLVVHKLEHFDSQDVDMSAFILQTDKIDSHNLYAELTIFVKKIKNQYIQQLCFDCLNDESVKSKLLIAPAAKTMHHAVKGGLLKHVVSICHLMEFVGTHYSFLNKDLLFFGALFHDLGKIEELEINERDQIQYTEKGQLLGHMLLACDLVEKKSQRILGFPDELKTLLKHIILSHHGKIEYGSPKLPMYMEAVVVAMVDDFDAKVDQIFTFINQEKMSGEKWSRYNENFQRYFYLEDLNEKWKS